MLQVLKSTSRAAIVAFAALAAAVLLLASTASAQDATSRVRVLHASPDAPAVDVYVNGGEAISDLAFSDITDYVELPAGDYAVQVFPAGANGEGDPVIDATLTLAAGSDYTVAAVGTLAEIEPLVLEDDNSAPPAGSAKVRFVHASPDAPAVDIYAEGAGVVVPNAAFKDASGYLELPADTYNLEVRAAGTDTVALDLPGVTLEAGNVYTAFAVGLLEGEPGLDAKLTVDATAAEAAPPAELPATGGVPVAEGSGWALWLAVAGALLIGATLAGGAVAFARAQTRR
jgi:hypothetical protein